MNINNQLTAGSQTYMMSNHNHNPYNSVNTIQLSIKLATSSILSSLTTLGFDLTAAEKQYKLVLNATTFSKPNAKAFEVIVHFLLCQLDSERAHRAFSQCWPVLFKEQQKDFKEIIYSWLTEIASPNRLHQMSTPTTRHPGSAFLGPSSNSSNVSSFHQSLLLHIKFPNISKSLLLSPGGMKICELLMSLIQYVFLARIIKLIENDKKNVRLLPKTSLLTSSSSGVKLLNQKQLMQIEIQANTFKRKTEHDFNEFLGLLSHQEKVRNQCQQYACEKIANIKFQLARKQELKESIDAKRACLHKLFGEEKENERSVQELYEKFENNELTSFKRKFKEFECLAKRELNDESKCIDYLLAKRDKKDIANTFKIDGNDFQFESEKNNTDSIEDSKNGKQLASLNEKILKFVYENIDQNVSIRNNNIGSLFHASNNNLDLINLTKLFNLALILKGDLLSKIDLTQINNSIGNFEMSNRINETTTSALLPIADSFTKSKTNSDSLFSVDEVNNQATDLKKKLEIFLNKIEERCDLLAAKLNKSIRKPSLSEDMSILNNSKDGFNNSSIINGDNNDQYDNHNDEDEDDIKCAKEALEIFHKFSEYSQNQHLIVDSNE